MLPNSEVKELIEYTPSTKIEPKYILDKLNNRKKFFNQNINEKILITWKWQMNTPQEIQQQFGLTNGSRDEKFRFK